MRTLKEITYEYAQLRGGGLPLTAEELCNCVVQWVQQYTQEQISASGEMLNKIRTATYEAISSQLPIKLNKQEANEGDYNLLGMDIYLDVQQLFLELMTLLEATDLVNYFEGSDTIVVDLNEAGDKIEIHLDGEVVAKLNRAILQPVNTVSEDSVPVVTPNRDVTYKPLSEIGGNDIIYLLITYSGPYGNFSTIAPKSAIDTTNSSTIALTLTEYLRSLTYSIGNVYPVFGRIYSNPAMFIRINADETDTITITYATLTTNSTGLTYTNITLTAAQLAEYSFVAVEL